MKQSASVLLLQLLVTGLYSMPAHAADFYVSPSGSASASGSSSTTPLLSINKALELAQPGDSILLMPGKYYEDVITRRAGTATAPIRIKGVKASQFGNSKKIVPEAILHGNGASHVFDVQHNYIALEDFVIDGLTGDPDVETSYRDKLLYVKSPTSALTGITIRRMSLRNAKTECLRFRYFVTGSEIAYSTIDNCGVSDFKFARGQKNGEGIYLGTSYAQWADGKNPTADPDQTSNNRVHHNLITTHGNECINLKEGTSGNDVYSNYCGGQLDVSGGGVTTQGNGNIIRDNLVYGVVGAGIKATSAMAGYGLYNVITGNTIIDNAGWGLTIAVNPQETVCGNLITGNKGDYYSYGYPYTPEAACID